jgi:ABC-type polysaccharide/polyol phosphate export permease
MFPVFREIVSRRNLVRELVVKDLKLRYSRSLLGFLWVFFLPFAIVAVFYLVFSVFLKVSTSEAPFLLYLMSAVFTWKFFQDSVVASCTSLVDNKNLIRESGFPHYFMPLSIVLSNAIIFLPALLILLAAAFVFSVDTALAIFLPLVFLLHFLLVLGLSIICSVIYVRFRDLKYILEVALMFLFYLTPAFYSILMVKGVLSSMLFKAYMLNPFTIMLNLYRAVTMKGFYRVVSGDFDLTSALSLEAAISFAVILGAFYYYRKSSRKINDYLAY